MTRTSTWGYSKKTNRIEQTSFTLEQSIKFVPESRTHDFIYSYAEMTIMFLGCQTKESKCHLSQEHYQITIHTICLNGNHNPHHMPEWQSDHAARTGIPRGKSGGKSVIRSEHGKLMFRIYDQMQSCSSKKKMQRVTWGAWYATAGCNCYHSNQARLGLGFHEQDDRTIEGMLPLGDWMWQDRPSNNPQKERFNFWNILTSMWYVIRVN